MRWARAIVGAMTALTIAGVAYGATHLPPSGWQTTPGAALSAKPASPACCATDATCCERQRAVDASTPMVMAGGVDVPLDSIAMATVRTAAAGQPGVDGAPGLHFVDGQGKPPPWKDAPSGEVRVLPPGSLGELKVQRDGYSPYFEKLEWRGMGYGFVRTVGDKGKVDLAGPYAFTVMGPGTEGKPVFDYVEGNLDDALKTDVRLWVHAELTPIARGTLFAFRQASADGEHLHVVMPEVVRAFEALGVEVDGAFFPSRFSQTWSFSDYVFPVKADLGLSAFFEVNEDNVRRWRVTGATPDKDWAGTVLLDLNGTEGGAFILRIRFPKG